MSKKRNRDEFTSNNHVTDLSTALQFHFKKQFKSENKSLEISNEKETKNNTKKVKAVKLLNKSAPKTVVSNEGVGTSGLSDLQLKFKRKLEGARFRTINEKLYSCKGTEAFEDFQKDPSLFDVYHEGYREQVKAWPHNPLDLIIGWIQSKHKTAVIADLGCGDARLATSVPNNVHSFDLVSKSTLVTACDISRVPLKDKSVDIVVFCLSLMGTNIIDFLREAYRILRPNGILKIAEVRSRFEGEREGIKKFIKVLKRASFKCTDKDFDNKMFFMLECVKGDTPPMFREENSAKACLYKKR